jgi:hypothetical protein
MYVCNGLSSQCHTHIILRAARNFCHTGDRNPNIKLSMRRVSLNGNIYSKDFCSLTRISKSLSDAHPR